MRYKVCKLSFFTLIIAMVVAMFMAPVCANAAETEDFQVWAPVNINKKFDENWRGFLELQARVGNDASLLKTAIVRPAIGYQFAADWTAWAGYLMQATVKSYDDNQYDIENRSWQGITYKHKFDNIIFEVRNRFEQRFLANNSDPEYRWRTRFRAEYLLPNPKYSVIASEEIFVNLNDNPTNPKLAAGPDQNRSYVGFGYRFNDNFQLESGYLKQYSWGYNGGTKANNDIWMTSANINF